MKLSQRLEMVASFVPEGSSIADIGTDHGYVPIFLMSQGMIGHGIAMDVRSGPLERAKEHIIEYGLEEQLEVRLSDGMEKLEPGEADCVIIAGMGGELMIHILEEGRHMWDSVGDWVLSPHSNPDKLRRFLSRHSFSIYREAMMKEDGKYYTFMGATRTAGVNMLYDREIDYRYGKLLLAERNPILKEYLEKEENQLKQIFYTLSDTDTQKADIRRKELLKELEWNKEARDEMQ